MVWIVKKFLYNNRRQLDKVLKSSDQLEKYKGKIDKFAKLKEEHQECKEQLTSLKNNLEESKTVMSDLEKQIKVTKAEKDETYKKLMHKIEEPLVVLVGYCFHKITYLNCRWNTICIWKDWNGDDISRLFNVY